MTKMLKRTFKERVNKTTIKDMVNNAFACKNDVAGVHLTSIKNFIRIEYNNYKKPGKVLQQRIKDYMKE